MKRLIAFVIALLAAGSGSAQLKPPTPAAEPGVVRISGNPQMEPLVRRWAEMFRTRHPGLDVEINLAGSDVAMAALYTDEADIALLGREAAEMEAKAFEWIYRYPPTRIEVIAGSVGSSGRSPALAVLVHRDNPISAISLSQLRAVFGAEGRTVSDWGGLGLRGVWLQRQIRLYAPFAESGTGRFFRQKVMRGSNKMAWDRLSEFADPVLPPGRVDEFGKRIARALAADPAGIAIASLDVAGPELKVIPVSGDGQAAVFPTGASVASARYPLARTGFAYVNRRPDAPLDSEVAAFVRFILSPEGQAVARVASDYTPLQPARATAASRLID